MVDQEREAEIIDRCRSMGIGQCGLGSIRNFIAVAFHHASLPGTLPADKHVAFNSAIRFATNRIACRGRHGDSMGMSRWLSREALKLRDGIAADGEPNKLARWRSQVTWEHQEPVVAVTDWATVEGRSVDEVVLQLLRCPGVVVTKVEEKAIPSKFRHAGTPGDRYRAAMIEPVLVDVGTADYFRSANGGRTPVSRGKYYWPFEPFGEGDSGHVARSRSI